jgi:hypothetical protein
VRAASTDGGVAPWSIEEIMIAFMSFPTAGDGASPTHRR